jgi:hypothetical protein
MGLMILLTSGAIAFFPGFWLLGLGPEERKYLAGRLRKTVERRRNRSKPSEITEA